jgi:hypothetical protein
MSTVDFITKLFCRVDDQMQDVPRHSQANLAPSEVTTLALLFTLKGVGQRAFWRWLTRDYRPLFPRLPDRTRLFRLFATHRDWADRFLAAPTLLGIADTFGIELCHPMREGRSPDQLGRKGVSNHRWIVGIKLALVINAQGQAVAWDWDTANVHDNTFTERVGEIAEEMATWTDSSFHRKEGDPANVKICRRGTHNERMVVERVLSLLTGVCQLKRMHHRVMEHLEAHLGFVLAVFNILTQWDGLVVDEDGRIRLSMAEFSL